MSPGAPARPAEGRRAEKRRASDGQSLVLLLIAVAICVVAAIVNPRFLRMQNIINIFQQVSILGIVACGIGMLLVAGQIDISAGSQISLMGIILALVIQKMLGNPGTTVPPLQAALAYPVAVGVVILLGLLMGLINGVVVMASRAFLLHHHSRLHDCLPRGGVALRERHRVPHERPLRAHRPGPDLRSHPHPDPVLPRFRVDHVFHFPQFPLWRAPVRHRRQPLGGVRVPHQDDAHHHHRFCRGRAVQRAGGPDPHFPGRLCPGEHGHLLRPGRPCRGDRRWTFPHGRQRQCAEHPARRASSSG